MVWWCLLFNCIKLGIMSPKSQFGQQFAFFSRKIKMVLTALKPQLLTKLIRKSHLSRMEKQKKVKKVFRPFFFLFCLHQKKGTSFASSSRNTQLTNQTTKMDYGRQLILEYQLNIVRPKVFSKITIFQASPTLQLQARLLLKNLLLFSKPNGIIFFFWFRWKEIRIQLDLRDLNKKKKCFFLFHFPYSK